VNELELESNKGQMPLEIDISMIMVHTTFHGIHRSIMTSLHKMFLIAELHTTFEIVMVIFLFKYLYVLYRKRIYSTIFNAYVISVL
jgi:hypothetical protein